MFPASKLAITAAGLVIGLGQGHFKKYPEGPREEVGHLPWLQRTVCGLRSGALGAARAW